MQSNRIVPLASALIVATLSSANVLGGEAHRSGDGDARMGGEHSMSQDRDSGMSGGQTASSGGTGISVDDLDDKAVVNRSGDQIGEVEEVVRNKQSHDLEAVVEVDTLMGLGEKEVTIPLGELSMRAGKLVTPDSLSTKDDLKARAEYDESAYDELAEAQQIEPSDFAAFEAGPSGDGMR